MVTGIVSQDRLSQMKSRATAQIAILDLARSHIPEANRAPVWEIGYGGGRTYDRLHRLFPENRISVFDNRPDGKEPVEADGNRFTFGDVFNVLPDEAREWRGKVQFLHADIGTPDFDRDLEKYSKLGEIAATALAPGALIASDRPIAAAGWTRIASGLEHNWSYFLWRAP
ncbi:MAG: class I SAM-dependent methyltransferase [Hyphomicrobiales bacterium]